MKRAELVTLLACALAAWPSNGLPIAFAPAPTAFAQTPRDDGARIAAEAKDAASRLRAYLDGVATIGSRPDFSKPPASDLLGQVFNAKQLEALPRAQSGDLPWLLDWVAAASGANKSIMFFGIAPPFTLQTEQAAIQRNVTDYEDQLAAGIDFLLRISAREFQATLAFLDQLAPAQRTPVRMNGLNKMRIAQAELVRNELGWITAGMKPVNARLISAAMRDTGAVLTTAILPEDRPSILLLVSNARAVAKDEETRSNLSAFGSLMETAN